MLNEYRHMMFDYFIKRTRKVYYERKKRLKDIKNRKDAEKYQEYVREKIKKAFSPFPLSEKTPLNPKITGIIERNGYRIEKIIFESMPSCFVTANLYIPEKFNPPFPAVVAPCGHSIEGKAEPKYQEFCQRLVHNGFLVLIYDPFDQGERNQYYFLPEKLPVKKGNCLAHNMIGKQMNLIGEFFGSYRVWDGIRAIDYITSRDEWDKNFLGITGNSGGGTLTTWLWAIDERLKTAAPGCFVTPLLYNLENELPQDSEQYPPGILGEGVEISDFFISRVPSPLILLGQKYDYFDIRGFKEICEELEYFYNIFDKKENFTYFIGDNTHGYHSDSQNAMVSFFCKIVGKNVLNVEPDIIIEKEKTLFATKKGNVLLEGSKPHFEIIREKTEIIIKNRKNFDESNLKNELKKILSIPESISIPHYRVLRPVSIKNESIGRYAVETEENIWVILKRRNVKKPYYLEVEEEINLYVPDISSEDEIKRFPDGKPSDYFVDVRGIGESMPDIKKYFFHPYRFDYMFDGFYLLFGESYLGKRIYDVLSVINLLNYLGCKRINLYGNRQGAIISLFVCLFSDLIERINLNKLPDSFYSLIKKPYTKLPSSNFPKGILKITDIPEILKIVEKKSEIKILNK
ncbi:MAG TPA: alpha/beta hydrolase family protein [bacterium]|nr:alpha/beta hydrolase family protein [bacterium]HOM26985.1 alpha/beta hydrolase family protein [bacterium]